MYINENKFLSKPQYLAPEIFTPNYLYNEKCDMWAIGIIVFNLLTSTLPYD